MNNSWFDKSFDGVSDDFFDDVIKYLDFPLESDEGTDGGGSGGEGVTKDFHLPLDDVEENNGGGGGDDDGDGEEWDCNFQNLEPPPANVLAGLSSGFYGDFFNDSLAKNHTVSCDGSSQLNQQSSTTKASSSRSITLHSEAADIKGSIRFQTSSPVSVLESSSSCSAANATPVNPKLSFLVKRSRSNRRRASTFNLQFAVSFLSSTSSTSRGSNSLVGSESESESFLTDKPAKKRQKKKKNLTLLSGSTEINKSTSQQPIIVRRCMHCEVTKTPQWRAGPMGPKTLCNACGVRYRSGRLLPEYRPAASPTFVPSLHSNSHKKVVEMRKIGKLLMAVRPSMLSNPPEKSFG
ncbi:GATA transcription factor 11-like [Durio zibethinus]|uniref:GATA transcription factor 11-like n=1 Tax=Durio zibethinus TaxID=66656 RepID=A0A6P5ZNA3_DURZI|nr:GATA transcription factor 11-like [Durio zibethinus]